jgi:hypothetical protein
MIGGGELYIDLAKMEAIIKWENRMIITKVRSFVEETHFLWKFITSFFYCWFTTPCHNIEQ